MRKLLRTQDILLLGLSGALDLFEEIKDPFYLVSKSYENMYGWIPRKYKRHNFTHLLWRNIKTGHIEKIEKEGNIYLRLTSRGNDKIKRDFPLLDLQKRKWDKKWRVVIFDIQETNRTSRDSLRKKLKELGFGMLQESVFISPHDVITDIYEFIKTIGLSDAAYVFEAQNLLTEDTKELANKVWNLDQINDKYIAILDKISSDKHLTIKHGRVKLLNFLKRIKEEYLMILLQDPFLPTELLPSSWKRNEVRILIREIEELVD